MEIPTLFPEEPKICNRNAKKTEGKKRHPFFVHGIFYRILMPPW